MVLFILAQKQYFLLLCLVSAPNVSYQHLVQIQTMTLIKGSSYDHNSRLQCSYYLKMS